MSDIVIGAGDRLPVVTRTVKVDGTPVDLTGGTVLFVVYDPSDMSTALSEAGTINSPATGGSVTYQWSAAAATAVTAGSYLARFVVTLGSRVLSVPNDGYMSLLVSGGGTGAFTYSGDPSLRPLDTIRYLLSDTDPADYYLSDAEIAFHLSETNGSVYQAAHDACYAIAGRFARMADSVSKSVGDFSLSKSYSGKAQQYIALAGEFMELATRREHPLPRANAQALTNIAKRGPIDPDTEFWLGIHDNPGQ